MQFLIETIM